MVGKVEIMGRKIEVLLDPGSEVSLLKSSVFKGLWTDSIQVRDSDLTVTQANGQKMELSGMVHLAIKVGGITTWSEDPTDLCQPPLRIFQTQRGHGRNRQSKQPEANVVVTNTIAITSTVSSSHTTLHRTTPGPYWGIEKTEEHESDGENNCNWSFWYSHQRIGTRTGGLGNKWTKGDHPNYRII